MSTPYFHRHVSELSLEQVTGLAGAGPLSFAQHALAPHSYAPHGGVLANVLRRYVSEPWITRIMQHNNSTMLPRAEQALTELCESTLFDAQSRVCQLTNRIALRGVLASPAATAREAAQRRWSLLVLECWLRRQTA